MFKDSKILGPSQIPSDKELQEMWDAEMWDVIFTTQITEPIETVTVEKAAAVFAEMLVELCPELLGFGGAAKEWENEFRKRLKE